MHPLGHTRSPATRTVYRIGLLRILLPIVLVLAGPVSAAAGAPISAHAMLYTCCTPLEMKERMVAEADALGADLIRVDVQVNDIFEDERGGPARTPDWRGLDEVTALARRHGLGVLAILMNPPSWISTCPERRPDHVRCPAADHAEFGRLAGEIAAHAGTAIDHWEIVNEPDGWWAFEGSPEQYARMLASAHDAIKARAPSDSVVLGGIMDPQNRGWLDRMMATPGADAARSFDIGNIHLRGPAAGVVSGFGEFRGQLARHGFRGPLWVTEQGYPADPAWQTDPAFTGGEGAQASYLTEVVVGLGEAGAAQVFVTLRDNPLLLSRYVTEGVAVLPEEPGRPVHRRPAFAAARRLADNWSQILAWRAEQRRQELLATGRERTAARWRVAALIAARRYRSARALVRDARPRAAAAGRRARGRATRLAEKRPWQERLVGARALAARLRTEHGWRKAILGEYRRLAAGHAQAAARLKAMVAGP